MILNGKHVASKIYDTLSQEIKKLDTLPSLWAILIGDDPVSLRYISQKQRFAEKIGMKFTLFQFNRNISEKDLLEQIHTLNTNSGISWYIVQLPLPPHIDAWNILHAIRPEKDVDGFHPVNQGKVVIGDTSWFVPCTPAGIMKILEYYDIPLRAKKVVVIGRSNIVGKPLTNLLIHSGATVTSCNSSTPDISEFTSHADIIISAVWKPNLIQKEMVSKHATIIDVGFSVLDGKIYGDCDYEGLLAQWNSITPVPGGVWPMTVAMLLSNTYIAHLKNLWITKS